MTFLFSQVRFKDFSVLNAGFLRWLFVCRKFILGAVHIGECGVWCWAERKVEPPDSGHSSLSKSHLEGYLELRCLASDWKQAAPELGHSPSKALGKAAPFSLIWVLKKSSEVSSGPTLVAAETSHFPFASPSWRRAGGPPPHLPHRAASATWLRWALTFPLHPKNPINLIPIVKMVNRHDDDEV